MATAGRILIIPKGEYSAEITYEQLDLVRNDGASWLCRKTCTGITPNVENEEYWYLLVDNMQNKWIDIDLSSCLADGVAEANSGGYLRFNTVTRELVGVITVGETSSIENQGAILTLPEDIVPAVSRVIGVGTHAGDFNISVQVLAGERRLLSSHSVSSAVTGPYYIIHGYI